MPDIRHIETVRVQPDIAPDDAGPGFSDMLSAGAGAQGLLYGTRPDETGLELREVGAGFGLRDRGAVAGSGVLDAPGRLILTEMDGDQVLLSSGRYGQDIAAVRLDAEGGFGNRLALRMVGADPAAVTAMAVTEGADLSVTASRQAPGLSVWQRTGETLIRVADRVAEDLLGANDVFDLGVIETGGQTRLLALSAGGDVLLSFALSPNGELGDVQQLGALDGLFMDRPDQLLTVQVDGQTYVLIGASGSGSLAVVALDAKGRMVLRDHVSDDLNTRFDNMSVLEAVTLDWQRHIEGIVT